MWLILSLTLLAQADAAGAPDTQPAANSAPAESSAESADEPNATSSEAASSEAAPAEREAGEDAESTSNFFKDIASTGALGLLLEGGVFMWPLLLMAVVAGGVIIERYRSLKMLTSNPVELRNQVRSLLEEDRVEEAMQLCENSQGPAPAILSAGLRKFYVLRRLGYDPARIESQVIKSMEDYSVHIVAALERHLPILATISSAAPMLGFLGTVQGMIVAFRDIVAKMGEMNIVEAAAAGIQVSLLTTCFGLIVGLPAFVAYNYFTSVVNGFVLQTEEASAELVEAVTLQMALAPDSAETPLPAE